jgi:hypothetical protein
MDTAEPVASEKGERKGRLTDEQQEEAFVVASRLPARLVLVSLASCLLV